MIAYAVLNEQTMQTGDPNGDSGTLLRLVDTFLALQHEVAEYHQAHVQACVTEARYNVVLPSGRLLIAALSEFGRMHPDKARRLRTILMNTPQMFDEHGNVGPTGAEHTTQVKFGATGGLCEAPALRAAWLLRGLVWSADHPDWQVETLPIQVRDAPGGVRNEFLANAYRAEIGPIQRAVLAQHVTVLPDFADEDHRHEPTHLSYDRAKSQIPKYARRILRHAVPVRDGVTWWAKCACGFYHRFQGTPQQQEQGKARVHWNATTNQHATGNQPNRGKPTTDADVPGEVKKQLAANRPLAESESGCRDQRRPAQA